MYEQSISRTNRGLIVFLVSQSSSMLDDGYGERSKIESATLEVNQCLCNLVLRCMTCDGVRDYMDIAVIGYGTDKNDNPKIETALGGNLAGRDVVTIVELEQNALKEFSSVARLER